MVAPFIDLTGSHHPRAIMPKMNRVNKIATFLKTIFLGPLRGLGKNSGKTNLFSFCNFCLAGDPKSNELMSNLNAKRLAL